MAKSYCIVYDKCIKVKMRKIYCVNCYKHTKSKNPKLFYIFKKSLVIFIICDKCSSKHKRIFKE